MSAPLQAKSSHHKQRKNLLRRKASKKLGGTKNTAAKRGPGHKINQW
jgi:hypothetical protein